MSQYQTSKSAQAISSGKLRIAVVLFGLATIFAFLEAIGGSTLSPARKTFAISTIKYDFDKRLHVLTDGICSDELKGSCASLSSFAVSAQNDDAIYALFLSLDSLAWIHILSASWSLLTTLVLLLSSFHRKQIKYLVHDETSGQKVQGQSEAAASHLHPLTKLIFCFTSCVLSVAVVIICIAIDFQARVVMDKADVDYDPLYSLGLGSAVLALIFQVFACFFATRESAKHMNYLIERQAMDRMQGTRSERAKGYAKEGWHGVVGSRKDNNFKAEWEAAGHATR